MFKHWVGIDFMFQDMRNSVNVGSTANVSGYEGRCCQCLRMLWKMLLMFQDMVGSDYNASGYGKFCQSWIW